MTKISEKSTKRDILAALKDAETKLSKVSKSKIEVQQTTKDVDTVTNASEMSVDSIVKNLANTRLDINGVISNLEEKLLEKKGELNTIQDAIKVEAGNLKDLHTITKSANTLEALLQAQEDERDNHEMFMKDTRSVWNKELVDYKKAIETRNNEANQEWKRTKEEYAYDTRLEKARAADTFKDESAIRLKEFEADIAERESIMSNRELKVKEAEVEISELKAMVKVFPKEQEYLKEVVTAELTKKLGQSNGFEVRAIKQSAESEKALLEQEVGMLKTQVENLVNTNEVLNTKLETAYKEVQEVAKTAITNSRPEYHLIGSDGKTTVNAKH